MPDLAVIMSVYHNDRLEFVRESIQSLLYQTFSHFHYYIIFDGPLKENVDSYINGLQDDRIRIYKLGKNSGLAVALNYLLDIVLKEPKYEFIARMDADDISLPMRFEKQRSFLKANPEISIVGSWYLEIDELGKHLNNCKLPIDHETLRKRYFTRTPFIHPSVMYHRSLIDKAGYYPVDTVLMEDNVLWGRAIAVGCKFANIPEYLLKYRLDKDFYKRRSGLKYGWNYILKRFEVNRTLKLPVSSYILSFFIGSIKMMPSFAVRSVFMLIRKD